MDSSSCIGQKGVIEEISDNKVSVNITKNIACEGCHAQEMCTMFDHPTRKITVSVSGHNFHTGDEVNVFMQKSMGWKATILAYLFPFLLMICTLIIMNTFRQNDLAAGIVVLLVLAVYFLCLYFIRDRLKREFHFMIEKSN
jgi:positive regulator of sigma E activity